MSDAMEKKKISAKPYTSAPAIPNKTQPPVVAVKEDSIENENLRISNPAKPFPGFPQMMPEEENQMTSMKVKKRDGSLELVDVTKIISRVTRCCYGLKSVDALRVATKAISGLYDGATTSELDELCIQMASTLVSEDPQYSILGARLLSVYIEEEVVAQKIQSFPNSVSKAFEVGLVHPKTQDFVQAHASQLAAAIDYSNSEYFEYFGLKTVYDRYLLRDPETRVVIETPQYFFMRVACGLSETPEEAINFYKLISFMKYMPSTPTLFNSGTRHPQMSSCYLVDSPNDDLKDIYETYGKVALLSKFSGGIGLAYHRVRSRGSLIPRNQRKIQRHCSLAENIGLFCICGKPRRQKKRSVLCVPRNLACRH